LDQKRTTPKPQVATITTDRQDFYHNHNAIMTTERQDYHRNHSVAMRQRDATQLSHSGTEHHTNHAGLAGHLLSRYSIDVGSISQTEHTHNIWRVRARDRVRVSVASIAIALVVLFIIIFAKYGVAIEKVIGRRIKHLGRGQVSAMFLSLKMLRLVDLPSQIGLHEAAESLHLLQSSIHDSLALSATSQLHAYHVYPCRHHTLGSKLLSVGKAQPASAKGETGGDMSSDR
jgi:hypothetical protein